MQPRRPPVPACSAVARGRRPAHRRAAAHRDHRRPAAGRAAALALLWANSPWRAAYADLSGLRVGPRRLHLDLPLGTWASDGLLAIFFFVAGLELKREFVAGDLAWTRAGPRLRSPPRWAGWRCPRSCTSR
jgi:hypothetical protein